MRVCNIDFLLIFEWYDWCKKVLKGMIEKIW